MVLSNFLTGDGEYIRINLAEIYLTNVLGDMIKLTPSVCDKTVTLRVGVLTKSAGVFLSALTLKGGHKKGFQSFIRAVWYN